MSALSNNMGIMEMNLLGWLTVDPQEPALLDHAPIGTQTECAYYEAVRRSKLHTAAERFGRPFKCAAHGLPREVFVTPLTIRVKL